ncbi:hypothetical protein FLL45_22000 [Aliikangiella marina]|uniref:Uncharacterized protein n=1 Tax=Aliikangiella marina TaxID=1712262 RepID=A0A545T1B3_9GAMM|nr:hypothetical protein [Aliikangiella marina]TQV71003.1 hypothetical protein FLL45_22000 [Aliikangiella marina]
MSLEHPGIGFVGILGKVGLYPSLEDLDLYVRGYSQCLLDADLDDWEGGWSEFIEWLRERDHFPTKGWAAKIIEEKGDGEQAFNRFKELLFEYLESEKPKWFLEFNLEIQPSAWWGLEGSGDDYSKYKSVPKKADIRIEKHIHLAS